MPLGDITEPAIVSGARFHEQLAGSWSAAYHSGSFSRRLAFFVPYLDRFVASGARWLDAGCGSGVLARQLAARGARVVAVDASPAMIAQGKGAQPTDSLIDFELVQTIESLPFPDGAMNGILCSSVLEYVDEPRAALQEFSRVLVPGGVAVITVPNRWSLIRSGQAIARGFGKLLGRSWFSYLDVSKQSFAANEIAKLLSDSGFVVEAIAGFSPYIPRVLVPLRMGALWLAVARRPEE